MRVTEVGEFGLIERLRGRVENAAGAHTGFPRRPAAAALVGIGDDCAVLRCGAEMQLSTTDTLVQDVHFARELTSWEDLGWKSLAVNLSDIAAMGGLPDYALITLGLPPTVDVAEVERLYDGLIECAACFGTILAGGDIVASPVWFISLTLVGHPSSTIPFPNNVLLRSAARAGDVVAVTGHVGSSAAGLRALQANANAAQPASGIAAFRRPVPRVSTGALALEAGVRCGMDVSDGLMADLGKLCKSSGVAATLDADRLPVQPDVQAGFPREWRLLALSGGEDYELLLTGPIEVLDAVRERAEVPVTIIGSIVEGEPGSVRATAEGRELPVEHAGWDHLQDAQR